ncbi:jupiter microtubule associated homolog 1a [Syngnathoides biaculeatus]|uniref:jupiter microtubule associated homolog 1a n=1 Tax=Syngnathoides biaculeatus TaxID=300417 RepID=UPI002ADD8F56|nr:jupiter microtubule associated homolog 1a [Syngnathoides biaculeatus]
MTTTTTFQGMEPGAKNSSRVLRPPGGASNISFGADEDKPPARKDKMASSVFAEPEDPYANRRNNPPGGKPTGVLCGESSAPLRRGATNAGNSADAPSMDGNTPVCDNGSDGAEAVSAAAAAPEIQDDPAAGPPSGRRNPPGGKSSLVLG